jgi:NAD(P)H-hydrate epimerase
MAGAIEAMDDAPGAVIAADVPSGVDASTGEVAGAAVHAAATATFHAAKPGLWIAPGKRYAGEVTVVDIGIPPGAPGEPEAGLIRPEVMQGMPGRGTSSTKFSSGNDVVVGGSRGLTGAPTMAALAATRAGAGYVTVAAPGSLELAFAVRLLEAMFVALPEDGGALSSEALEPAVKAVGRADAVVLGPGLGKSPGAQALARELVQRIDVPLVIDADGLNALAGRLEMLRHRRWPTVLTPHAGELGRLLEIESAEIERARLAHARLAAARASALVVLKGDDTLIVGPDGRVAISRGNSPALATAGTGDVLTGAIAALLGQRLDAFTAAAAAVQLHAQAGREAARRQGCAEGVIAGDVIAALAMARGV